MKKVQAVQGNDPNASLFPNANEQDDKKMEELFAKLLGGGGMGNDDAAGPLFGQPQPSQS